MSKITKYALLLTLCKMWDLYTTWLRTPDLSRELNPFVRYLGLGWIGLMLSQIFALIVTVVIVRRAIHSDRTLFPSLSGLTFSQFASYLYFGKMCSVWHLLWSVATSFDRFWYCLAGILLYAALLIHIATGTSNLVLTLSPAYVTWFNTYLTLKLVIEYGIIILLSLFVWLSRDYKAYKIKAA